MEVVVVVVSVLVVLMIVAVLWMAHSNQAILERQRSHYEGRIDEFHQILSQFMATQLNVAPPEQRTFEPAEPEFEPTIPPGIEAMISSIEGVETQQELRQDVLSIITANHDVTEEQLTAALFESV